MNAAERTPCITCLRLGEPAFTFTCWRRAMSQNELKANHGSARFRYAAERKAWVKLFRNRLDDGAVTRASGRRIVRFTRVYSGRERIWDRGNLVGGFKAIVDAMQPPRVFRGKTADGASIILGDSIATLLDVYEQERSTEADNTHVRVEIWEQPAILWSCEQ